LIYLETSVLAAFYVPEPLSAKAERAVRSEAKPAISELTELEFFSAVARKVRSGGLARPTAAG
jgi:predicted nucleic acid-binding protein